MKKIHFYEGKTPLPKDFDDLQAYAEDGISLGLQSLAGAGVLSGLDAGIDTGIDTMLSVTEGRAINASGHILELASQSQLGVEDGRVILRYSVEEVGRVADIKQQLVWESKQDKTALMIVAPADVDDKHDVILGTITHGTYSTEGRQVALAWNTLKDYIDTSIATAKAEAKAETKDELIPVGFEYVQLPNSKAPKAGVYERPNNKGTVTITEDQALGWPGKWEIHEDYADSSIVFEGADNRVANDPNKTYDDIALDVGAQPFDSQPKPMPDAGREIVGKARRFRDTGLLAEGTTEGAFLTEQSNEITAMNLSGMGSNIGRILVFKASRSWGIINTAAQFRTQQYTVRGWRRVS